MISIWLLLFYEEAYCGEAIQPEDYGCWIKPIEEHLDLLETILFFLLEVLTKKNKIISRSSILNFET